MVTLPGLPVLSCLVQRILQATQRTKKPHRKKREKRKERTGLQKSTLGTLQSLIKFSHPCLTLRQEKENMLIFLLMFCY